MGRSGGGYDSGDVAAGTAADGAGLVTAGGLQSGSGWTPTSYTEAAIPGHDVPGTVLWDFSEVSPTGVTGDVSLGSAETGQVWVKRILAFCSDYIREYDKNTAA